MNSAKANRTLILAALTLFWCMGLFCAEYVADYKLPVDHPTTVSELLDSPPTHFLQVNNSFEHAASSRTRYDGSSSGLIMKAASQPNKLIDLGEYSFCEWTSNAIHTTNLKKILYPFHEFI